MTDERLFIVTYDISDAKRWRRVFKVMHGYGEWLQLSVGAVASCVEIRVARSPA